MPILRVPSSKNDISRLKEAKIDYYGLDDEDKTKRESVDDIIKDNEE